MKRLAIIAAALVTACVMAQDKAGPAREGGRQMPHARGPMMQQSGMWVTKMLSNKHGLERIGVTDPALCDKIIAAVSKLKEKGDDLEQKIRAISREQAELTRGLLEDKERDPKPVMDKIGEVARLRAEQGKISVRALLVLRDYLAPEQLTKVKEMIKERGRERMRQGPRGEGNRPGAHRRGEPGRNRAAKASTKE